MMSTILISLEATAKSVSLLFSSHSSRRISTSLLRHGHQFGTRYQQLHVATPLFRQGRRYPTTPKKISDPLHILFCGSDEFSCASLKALHDEHVQNPDLIRSIDVVVRPGKGTGRGYKVVRHPPIRSLAESLGLQIHERDTFTGWNMPAKTNLIIAVSFGLFVPPRLLRGAKYGGLNLHPSLLPDFRGPAPLHHTLLSARKVTGVSLQTLDHNTFDHGVVLAQTPSSPRDPTAVLIPPGCRTVAALQALVTPVAARMLIEGLRAGLHVPPLEDRGWKPNAREAKSVVHAPKITKADQRLTAALLRTCDRDAFGDTLARRQAAIGPLWFEARDRKGRRKRVIIESLKELPADVSVWDTPGMLTEGTSALLSLSSLPPGTPRRYPIPFFDGEEKEEKEEKKERREATRNAPQPQKMNKYLVFWDGPSSTPDKEQPTLCLGNYLVSSLKVEGDRPKLARLALQNFKLFDDIR
ncbi:formyl transferase [Xylaria longipes]|nr:formyl transferase [Xylaria longipes]